MSEEKLFSLKSYFPLMTILGFLTQLSVLDE